MESNGHEYRQEIARLNELQGHLQRIVNAAEKQHTTLQAYEFDMTRVLVHEPEDCEICRLLMEYYEYVT